MTAPLRKHCLLVLTCCFTIGLHAQNQLTHYVVGSVGGHSQGSNFTLNSTVGEVAITTGVGGTTITTEGFHQPRFAPVVPAIYVSGTDASCPGQDDGSVMIDSIVGCTGPFTIIWSTNDTTMMLNGLPAGTYLVNVLSSDCNLNAEITIGNMTDGPCELLIYNGITPNGDGWNDQWILENINLFGPNKVSIFNRWGQLIWSADKYNNGSVVWEGKDSADRELPDGTYFYVIELTSETYKGYVELTH